MPLRPCASCSKRSCMASRSPAPSLRLIPRNLLHFFCDCVPSNQVFAHHWGQLRLKDEMGLLSTRQPVMSNRESFYKRREKGGSNHSLGCPLPWSPRTHKSSAGIAAPESTIGIRRGVLLPPKMPIFAFLGQAPSSHLWNGKFTTRFQMPYDAMVGDVVNMTVTVTDIQRDMKGQPFVSRFTIKGTPEAEDTQPPPPGVRPPGSKRNDNGKHSAPQLATPDIREVRRDKWADPQFQFDEYSAVKIINADEGNGYTFFINMDNRFLIHELHKTKEEEGRLIKHWFKYGVVLSALGILKELQRVEEEGHVEEDKEQEQFDLERVGRFCAGLARV